MIVYENPFMVVHFSEQHKTLLLNWQSATESMTEQDFRDALTTYADLAFTHKTPGLIVDLRSFLHSPSAATGAWRVKHICPIYNQAGVQRFAYIALPEMMPPSALPQPPEEDFITRFFTSTAAAQSWASGTP